MSTSGDGQELWAVSSLDGRYRRHLDGLSRYVSEGALITYRVRVEAAWLLHLAATPGIADELSLSTKGKKLLTELASLQAEPPSGRAASWQSQIKEIENTTNHDVKAVEYYLQHRLRTVGEQPKTLAFIHFACTSEDINNLAYALMLRDVIHQRLIGKLNSIMTLLVQKVDSYSGTPMLARTHGQTASPTTLGKELAVFAHRLWRQYQRLTAQPIEGKINGAVGNYNAHMAAFPDVDWPRVAKSFVEERLGLKFNPLTTQIENHDAFVEACTTLKHINTVLIGLCRDLWSYISIGYFRQVPKPGEVGSSTMPHKVNPIDFENAEGNLGIAAALATHFSDKLPISRWQRDLSDSTVLRAFGTMIGHSELAWRSLERGLEKIDAAEEVIANDLARAWEVLAEPIQTVMRRYGVDDAYERLKAATRGRDVTREVLWGVIDRCAELPDSAKNDLKLLTPAHYIGAAARLAEEFSASLPPDVIGGGG